MIRFTVASARIHSGNLAPESPQAGFSEANWYDDIKRRHKSLVAANTPGATPHASSSFLYVNNSRFTLNPNCFISTFGRPNPPIPPESVRSCWASSISSALRTIQD